MKKLLLAGLAVLAGLQVVPSPYPRTNPPVLPERRIEAHIEMPAYVAALLDRSCRDCHSNLTDWPWYSRLAPVGWIVARDVQRARAIMNFSEWNDKAGQNLEKAMGMLAAACGSVQVRRMPKPEYLLLHRRAVLSDDDVRDFCGWSAKEGTRLVLLKRKRREQQQ